MYQIHLANNSIAVVGIWLTEHQVVWIRATPDNEDVRVFVNEMVVGVSRFERSCGPLSQLQAAVITSCTKN